MNEGQQRKDNVLATATDERTAPAVPFLEQIFQTHYSMVYRTAFRVTGSHDDAEDVLQTVFLRLARREADETAMDNPEAYLRKAAVHCALDHLRARRPRVDLDSVELVDHSLPSPERRHGAMEITARLRELVAQLSPAASEMFVLRYFEDRDNSEIAEMLNTTANTVNVTLHRAREWVRKEIAKELGKI